ncbi:uncharacterized protein LY89DRAFT_472673 [Mollisia scopiformis]|uniref:Uncharacterized protein n=1 Tax=Mollisia scopiformis TaxID=149040 RepID=A0A194XJ53_MOLSC|nr:uncharacterized protein LY89DRAFT_472673 [Mollisia scopiformis]KUJ20151.1 hypothetical protein LY89DRAFT_472673 [Mollisia scopiformis]
MTSCADLVDPEVNLFRGDMATPRPTPPRFYEPLENATWGDRFSHMVMNYINHPSLLQETPTGQLWNCQPSSVLNPDLGHFIAHLSKTILVTDPAYPELFHETGLDGLPNLHHVTITIATRIVDRTEDPPGRCHEILVVAKGYDSADNVFGNTDEDIDFMGCYGPGFRFCMDAGGWADAPVNLLLPILRDIFGDWRCVVEYLKYMIRQIMARAGTEAHPLVHMHILGDGLNFRREMLRIAGTIEIGFDIVDGAPTDISKNNMVWQVLQNGRWEDL